MEKYIFSMEKVLDYREDIEKLNFKEFKEIISSLDFSNYTITTIHNPKKDSI